MLEYAVVGTALLGEKVNSFLNFDSFSGYASILGAGGVERFLSVLKKPFTFLPS